MTSETEDFLEHFGVKGMKWGARQSSSSAKSPSTRQVRKEQITNRDLASFSVKTKLGETVDVKQVQTSKIALHIASLSKS